MIPISAFKQVIPVVSKPVVPPVDREPVYVPDVGARWGKTSEFQTGEQIPPPSNTLIVRKGAEHVFESRIENFGAPVRWVTQKYLMRQNNTGQFFPYPHPVSASQGSWWTPLSEQFSEDGDYPPGATTGWFGSPTYSYTAISKSRTFEEEYVKEATFKLGTETLYEIIGTKPGGGLIRQPHEITWYLTLQFNQNVPGPNTGSETVHGEIPPPGD